MPIHIHTKLPETLCATCKSSSVVRSDDNQLLVHCHAFEKNVNAVVVECSSYHNKNHPYEHELIKMAWLIDPNPKRKAIGFIPPGTKEHTKLRHGVDIDYD